jgi:SAM-dependent methyltransferase
MAITQLVREGRRFAFARITANEQQNFLGAPWVGLVINKSPKRIRKYVALRLLSLSPHYFYDSDIRAEAERNQRSRQAIAEAVIHPHVNRATKVIDYGCGPGYMARAVARRAAHVEAVDISSGVVACARALNAEPNISYRTLSHFRRTPGGADLAYSFAVVQHLRTDALADALRLLAAKVRPGGTLLLHFAAPGQDGWRTEDEWDADQSIFGRAKLRYGLHCFGRTPSDMKEMVCASGFASAAVQPLADVDGLVEDDDVSRQYLLVAQRQ